MDKVNIIRDNTTLKKFCKKCINEKVLAIDTEFIRENTYYPILSLIQIASDSFSAIIDPLSDIDLQPFWEILSNKKILKVFHAGRQDIEIFFNLTGKIPTPIYDTQIAAMFCGLGDQVSYDGLVNKFLGLTISKESQFSNWLQRPLANKQLQYALSDVTHLIKIFPLIKTIIKETNREEWVEKEFQYLTNKQIYNTNPKEVWKKIKIKNPKREVLNILKYLAEWREIECKKRNLPRNRLIRDEILVTLSQLIPSDIFSIKKIRGIPKTLLDNDLNNILKIIKSSQKIEPDKWPKIPKHSKKINVNKGSLDLLKLLLSYCSQKSGLAEKLITDADELRLILDGEKGDLKVFSGWRNEIFGKFVKLLLNGQIAFTIRDNKIKKIEL
jgi:ribonuclease D